MLARNPIDEILVVVVSIAIFGISACQNYSGKGLCADEVWPSWVGCQEEDGHWVHKSAPTTVLVELPPEDGELGTYDKLETPTYISNDTGLYAMLNGGSDVYLDLGWQVAIFTDYSDGTSEVSVRIHDMGSQDNAQELFTHFRAPDGQVLWDEPDSAAVLDRSLPISYEINMWMDRFYVEIVIAEKGISAETIIDGFASVIRSRTSSSTCIAVCD